MPKYIKVFKKALPPEFCQRLIDKFDADPNVKPDPQPGYSTRHYINISVQKDWAKICTELAHYTGKVTEKYFKLPKKYADVAPGDWFDDGYVIARYNVGDICSLHYDGQCADPPNNGFRLATQLFYLNTVKVGGETSFPLQKVKIKPEIGKAVMFPVEWTYPHEVLKAKSVRYILQTWITDPEHVVMRGDEIEYAENSGIIFE